MKKLGCHLSLEACNSMEILSLWFHTSEDRMWKHFPPDQLLSVNIRTLEINLLNYFSYSVTQGQSNFYHLTCSKLVTYPE